MRRNPKLTLTPANAFLPTGNDPGRAYPSSHLMERYNDFNNANRATSACGLGLYRDTLLGEEYYGNAFTCEPVHNLVHREVVTSDGVKFSSHRASDESQSEFFSSSDNWFRPVHIHTGPDGALYVVDMYRFLIEHPRWLSANRLAQIDVRAGSDKGRIYRIKPVGKQLRLIHNLRKLNGEELAAALNSPNGTERDRVHIELLTRRDPSSISKLVDLASTASLPQLRVQALCVVEGLGGLTEDSTLRALADSDPHVRQNAIRLAENFLIKGPSANLANTILNLTHDSSPIVIHQLALTLGEWNDPRAGLALASMAKAHLDDSKLREAILSSASRYCGEILAAVTSVSESTPGRKEWIVPLLTTTADFGNDATFRQAFAAALSATNAISATEMYDALGILLDGAEQRKVDLQDLRPRLTATLANARQMAADIKASEASRVAAIKLLGKVPNADENRALLCDLATGDNSKALRTAAITALRQQRDPDVAHRLLAHWTQTSPSVRTDLVPLLIERQDWTAALLEAIKQGSVQTSEISVSERQRIAQSSSDKIRQMASTLFSTAQSGGRDAVIHKYASIKTMEGKRDAGADVFKRNCSTCHALDGIGTAVGPDLATLRDKDADYFLKNILDPNAAIEPRFVAYNLELKDERSILGIIKSENSAALTLMMSGGQTETVSRSNIKEIRASSLSLMPEGLETAIKPAEMADLVAFLKGGGKSPSPDQAVAADVLLLDAASIAHFVLDEKQPNKLRENAINTNPQFAGNIIAELTRNLIPGTPEEYRRIPWIWRAAIASGKRNDGEQIKRILEVSLPAETEPLHEWQAVVLGGGVINGISQRNQWPAQRIADIIARDEGLQKRWKRALDLASTMADNSKVPSGTRYDALRMLGVEPWTRRGEQLCGYLTDKNSELQMGAVSGLVDVNSTEATRALIGALSQLSGENRRLALEGLLRDKQRTRALLDEISAGRIAFGALGEAQTKRLLSYPDKQLRSMAVQLSKSNQ